MEPRSASFRAMIASDLKKLLAIVILEDFVLVLTTGGRMLGVASEGCSQAAAELVPAILGL